MNNKKSYKIALMVIMFVMTINAFSIPAKKVWRTLTLSDGTKVEAMLIGDEHGHWFVDRNGKALAKSDDGKAFYMSDSQLLLRKESRAARAQQSNARRIARMEARREKAKAKAADTSKGMRKTFGEPTTISGKKKGIVILAEYSDKTFKYNKDNFDKQFNQEGYNLNGHIGSVHDYFYDQSYGKFDVTFDVVGPVKLPKTHDYYGSNDKEGNDSHPGEMVCDAIKLADKAGVDFSQYDWDNDGEVDQVYVIYQGTGEATSDITTDIWPHEWELESAAYYNDGDGILTFDGVKINTYAVSNEIMGSGMDGIGTACHEFSHCLGYADLYDTDYSGGQGMMSWDVLDAGSYNGPNDHGEVPAAYTSFERWWAGWLDLTELSSPQFVSDMPALNDEPVAYVIYNDAYPDEYYLLENRQAKGWDTYTASNGDGAGHGMLILHVDYDKSVWQSNSPNDAPSRQRMTYFPADGSYGTYYKDYGQWGATFSQLAGDPFPGTNNKTSFTDTTTPAATLYNANSNGKKYMSKPITDIAETKDGKISFTFMGGIQGPKATEASLITSNGFTANWEPIDGAESYELEVKEISQTAATTPVFVEEFTKLASTTSDGTTNLANKIDSYTDNKGWTVSACYASAASLKIGSSKNAGYAITPTLATPSSGEATVRVSLKGYGDDNTSPIVSVVDTNGKNEAQKKTCSNPGTISFENYILNFENLTNDFKVKFFTTAKKRFYLGKVEVFDGKYSESDLDDASGAKGARKASSVSTIINGITGTSYTYTDITEGMNYKYRVRAVVGDKTSAWSSYVSVLISTSIADVSITEPTSSRIYNLNGQYVGSELSRLPSGIYIIGTRKVIKK